MRSELPDVSCSSSEPSKPVETRAAERRGISTNVRSCTMAALNYRGSILNVTYEHAAMILFAMAIIQTLPGRAIPFLFPNRSGIVACSHVGWRDRAMADLFTGR